MHRALNELTILGVETSREFHLRVMEDPEFQRGEIEIQWLERRLPSLTGAKPPLDGVHAAAIAAALLADRDRCGRPFVPNGNGDRAGGPDSTDIADPWRRAARLDALR
jgi:acetyl/propionyl-CoA carboxylase alpha subunit